MGKKYMDTKKGSLEQSILDVWKESAELPEQPETEHGSGEHAFEVGTKRFDDYTRKITPGQLEEAFLLLDEQVDEEGVEFFTEEQWEIVEKLQDMTEEEHDALLDEMTEDQLEMYEGILGAIGRGIKKGAKRVFTKQGRADAKLKKAKKKEKLQQTKADTVGAKVKAKELKKSRKKQAADAGIGIRGKAIKGAKAAGRGAKKVAGAAKAGAKKVGAAIKKSAEDLEVPEGQEVVYEAKDWNHGVLVGASVGSETTAAASGDIGVVRRDPMAMKPFCGYNFADYWRHWFAFSKQSNNLPKIFHVNWFRKNDQGFLWPGFGENLRVLDWIIQRCQNKIDAKETPIGYVPMKEDINTSGLNISDENLNALLTIEPDQWLIEMNAIKEYFNEFGKRLPNQLLNEHAKVVDSLNK